MGDVRATWEKRLSDNKTTIRVAANLAATFVLATLAACTTSAQPSGKASARLAPAAAMSPTPTPTPQPTPTPTPQKGTPQATSTPTSSPATHVATSARPPQTSPAGAPPQATSDFAALWPETATPANTARLPAWRGSPEATVAHFAVAVFDWKHPTVHAAHSIFSNVEKGVRVFSVRSSPSAPSIEVHAAAVVNAHIWSVVYFWGFGRSEPAAAVWVRADKADISFGYWGPAASADLVLQYGSHTIRRTSERAAKWSFPINFPLKDPGAVMVLFRDRRGVVFTGWGTPLRAGEFSAG